MTQQLFASLTSPSLVNLDANFSELYGYAISYTYYPGAFLLPGKADAGGTLPGAFFESTAALNYGQLNFIKGSASGTGSTAAVRFYYAGTVIGSIANTSTATTYNTTSDRRLKCDIAPAVPFGDLIDGITVVQHGWRNGGTPVRHGFIAQELATVYPEAVTAGDHGPDVVAPWGVDNSKLVPLLLLELQSLRARVALLEDAA